MENLVPKTPKAERGKSLDFRNVFASATSRSDSKISNSLTVNVINKKQIIKS
jgi:hypothetical protein